MHCQFYVSQVKSGCSDLKPFYIFKWFYRQYIFNNFNHLIAFSLLNLCGKIQMFKKFYILSSYDLNLSFYILVYLLFCWAEYVYAE